MDHNIGIRHTRLARGSHAAHVRSTREPNTWVSARARGAAGPAWSDGAPGVRGRTAVVARRPRARADSRSAGSLSLSEYGMLPP
ncbi:hypothetical protein [Sorangium sp. So ce854]|uniref:hypothetical protein n=1 Tax=Sorangium sp. So ce854 TaxID=3133322 RepID=UPI003F5D6CDE